MQFDHLCFFISQIVFVPTFLVTTRMAFKPEMKLKHYIGYFIISPFCVYVFSIFFYGLLSLVLDGPIFQRIASYADVFALILSFCFAALYSRTSEKADRPMMLFTYISFYMAGMIFNLVYETPVSSLVFSVLIPFIATSLMYKHFTLPLTKIAKSKERFHRSMLLLPIAAEAMLVLRFILNVISIQDIYLEKYDSALMIYSTLFGYIILLYILVCTGMITKDIDQIEQIDRNQKTLISANNRIKKLTLDMLMALVGTIEAKDEYTNGHSNRVAEYSKMIALRLNFSEDEVQNIYRTALLHDIGKIAIPDEIINKPGKLTKEEFMHIMQHPMKGAEILKGIEEIPDLYLGALYHHERWDGKGYPYGLHGEQIPLIARIISVADAYDAMTSKRSYRAALDQETVISEIENGMGTQFYPDAAQAMLSIIKEDKLFDIKQK